MQLLRCLTFIQAKYQFDLLAAHIHVQGKVNVRADALSRGNVQYFLSLYPQARRQQAWRQLAPLPIKLLDLTVIREPDWTSQELDRLVELYFQAGLVPSTHSTYNWVKKRFITFCNQAVIVKLFPLNQQLLCRYVAHLAEGGVS